MIRPGPLLLAAVCSLAPLRAADRLNPPAPRPPGVTPAVEAAIERGIQYLLKSQQPDGSWGASPQTPDVFPVAITGLAGLALLAHGDSPTRGEHAAAVSRLVDYFLSCTTEHGLITTGMEDAPRNRKGARPMYGHAFAMTVLAQVVGEEPDASRRAKIGSMLREAVKLTQRSQSKDGGWAYSADWWEDEGTLTVTQLQALRSCRDAGFMVPKRVIDRGVEFIEKSKNDNGSVRYRVQDTEVRAGVTCAAVVALWNAGQYDSQALRQIQDYVNRNIRFDFTNRKHAEYVSYYLTQAKWIMGGQEWLRYYTGAASQLVSLQDSDGHWEGPDERQYGETFATAIALIVLQMPYDRLTVYQR